MKRAIFLADKSEDRLVARALLASAVIVSGPHLVNGVMSDISDAFINPPAPDDVVEWDFGAAELGDQIWIALAMRIDP